jgi:hypothetical protein
MGIVSASHGIIGELPQTLGQPLDGLSMEAKIGSPRNMNFFRQTFVGTAMFDVVLTKNGSQ